MGKMRNGSNDVQQLTQWLGRKCRNHHPLQELGLTTEARDKKSNIYAGKKAQEVFVVDDGAQNTLLYAQGERVFRVTVEEVGPNALHEKPLLKVGY